MHEKPSSQNIDFLEENYVYRGRVNGLNIHAYNQYQRSSAPLRAHRIFIASAFSPPISEPISSAAPRCVLRRRLQATSPTGRSGNIRSTVWIQYPVNDCIQYSVNYARKLAASNQ
ncbi:hypothetical protein GCK32_002275 [Trichostrongylus colubriformis]|uniref:Uncharacterized protein n=1 Tax=Trichostrongylus colubriformis TaxID=6319 RepID=A0AAN8F319_TRICO